MSNFDLGKEAFIAFSLSLAKSGVITLPTTREELEGVWNKSMDEARRRAWQDAALKAFEVSNGQG
ncbi:hypothetical protein VF14_09040 [Nostoc linckia z18]|uniref:Uncharacterized protein n=2 Tax=Nostoc linckia TaxID=92942 RepID=A0A9Q6EM70_NOSLI|nr:hypothetical protein [Nostoc linckia]PHK32493.1 hypothetical protein VF12_26590 [Nostoc linckia z15]PHK44561.1 hypothetical protein VF13_21390 [Nostoc linckia z16]PHJ59605.1 hypothetical protein VF02_24665 [Nostoc linckia z1]PHJ65117.1 hypothetical protein VF05_21485 [Nostoc linckia z3]PHJ69610.1 hypothetical protein VF03_23745 [Nostoc linckia z2]